VTAKETKKVEPSAHNETAEKPEEKMEQEGEKDMAAALAEVMNKLQESEEKVLRLAADFENSKKRLEREREISLKYAEENILKELLPGIDNIERAMDQGQEANNMESLLHGVELTRDGLLATLEKYGVKATWKKLMRWSRTWCCGNFKRDMYIETDSCGRQRLSFPSRLVQGLDNKKIVHIVICKRFSS